MLDFIKNIGLLLILFIFSSCANINNNDKVVKSELDYDNQKIVLSQVAGRILGNSFAEAKIFSPNYDKNLKVARIMVMARNMSEKDRLGEKKEKIVHSGFKLLFDIPIVNGNFDTKNAILVNISIIEQKDDGKDRGIKVSTTNLDTKIEEVSYTINSFDIPKGKIGEKNLMNTGYLDLQFNAKLNGKIYRGYAKDKFSIFAYRYEERHLKFFPANDDLAKRFYR